MVILFLILLIWVSISAEKKRGNKLAVFLNLFLAIIVISLIPVFLFFIAEFVFKYYNSDLVIAFKNLITLYCVEEDSILHVQAQIKEYEDEIFFNQNNYHFNLDRLIMWDISPEEREFMQDRNLYEEKVNTSERLIDHNRKMKQICEEHLEWLINLQKEQGRAKRKKEFEEFNKNK